MNLNFPSITRRGLIVIDPEPGTVSHLSRRSQCNGFFKFIRFGSIKVTVRRRYSLLDIFGVLVVGLFMFGILGILVFSSERLKGIFSFLWVAGVVAFGLYHMIGFKLRKHWVCSQCGKSGSEE